MIRDTRRFFKDGHRHGRHLCHGRGRGRDRRHRHSKKRFQSPNDDGEGRERDPIILGTVGPPLLPAAAAALPLPPLPPPLQ